MRIFLPTHVLSRDLFGFDMVALLDGFEQLRMLVGGLYGLPAVRQSTK
jgi:hypothetical protein